MPKYYQFLEKTSSLSTKSGAKTEFPLGFEQISIDISHKCSFIQKLIQEVIYETQGERFIEAKRALKEFKSPKSRINFIGEFSYKLDDHTISKCFDFARDLFIEIYELRNILAHEEWMLSDKHKGLVLFSSLEEHARLKFSSARLLNDDTVKSEDVHKAIIRYIENVKTIRIDDLKRAQSNADLCAWVFQQISNILQEKDADKAQQFKETFYIFGGTSHLFDRIPSTGKSITVKSSKGKTIRR